MTPASRRQALGLLTVWKAAPECGLFDFGILSHVPERMMLREGWDFAQASRSLAFLAGRNAAGHSIYARPARELDAHPWIRGCPIVC